jgi:hypothetical protein
VPSSPYRWSAWLCRADASVPARPDGEIDVNFMLSGMVFF